MAKRLLIYRNGKAIDGKGIRDSEKLLKEYLPDLTADLIGSVIILGQGLPDRFTNNSPSGRKEVLEKLCKSDFMIEDLKTRIANRKNQLSTKLRDNEDNLLRINTKLDIDKRSLEIQRDTLNNLLNQPDYTETSENLRTLIEKSYAESKKLDAEYEKLSDESAKLIDKRTSCSDNKSVELLEVEDKYSSQIASYQEQIYEFDTTIKTLQNQIQTVENMKDTCPTCGQRLPHVHKPDCTEWKNSLEINQNERTRINNSLQELLVNKTSEKDVISNKYRMLEATINAEYQDVINKQRLNKDACAQVNASCHSYQQQLNDIEIKVQTKQQNIDTCNESITQLTSEIAQGEADIITTSASIDIVKERLGIINKFSTVVTRDFRGYLLESVIVFIDNKLKEYAKKMFDTELISFKLDGNNISISYNNKEYEALSGGERQKLDLLIQFAIRQMLCTYVDFNTNVLILDEIFDSLDSVGTAKVIDFISTQLSDISSIFVISHHSSELSIPNDDEVVVIKEADEVSYIK